MSIRAIGMVLDLGPEVAGAKRLVLIALADNMNDEGYAYPKRKTIARKAGIKRLETVTECLSWLESNGWIDRHVNAWSGTLGNIPADKRPNVYRFTAKITKRSGSPDTGEGCSPDTGEPRPTDTGDQNRHLEPSVEPTPLPPDSGGDDGPPKLFDDHDPGSGCDSPAEKKRAARRGRGVSAINAEYHKAWRRDEYPSGKIGSNAKSETAFVRALKRGDTIGDLNRRTRNYVAARELYLETVGEEAPLLHASTFLGSRSMDWDQPWTVDGPEFSLASSSWPMRKRKAAPVSSDDMLADAQAKWEAEQLAEMRGQNGQDGRNV